MPYDSCAFIANLDTEDTCRGAFRERRAPLVPPYRRPGSEPGGRLAHEPPVYLGPPLKDQTPTITKTGARVPRGLRGKASVAPGAAARDARVGSEQASRAGKVGASILRRQGSALRGAILAYLRKHPVSRTAREVGAACGCVPWTATRYLRACAEVVRLQYGRRKDPDRYWHRDHDARVRARLSDAQLRYLRRQQAERKTDQEQAA